MPIKIDKKLPAVDILRSENIFVMDDERAEHQDIRPMNILILNVMPKKTVTETQLLRHLANTPCNFGLGFFICHLIPSKQCVRTIWRPFIRLLMRSKGRYFAGLIIAGAQSGILPFEAVDYWEEFRQVID